MRLMVVILTLLIISVLLSNSKNLFYMPIVKSSSSISNYPNSKIVNIKNSSLKPNYHTSTSQNLTLKKVAKPLSVRTKQVVNNKQLTVYFDNFGFDPNEVTVPIGYQVSIKNISNLGPIFIEAVNWQGYPLTNSIFNLGEINENQAKTITINQKGVWQYQADDNPSYRAVLGTGQSLSVQSYMEPNGLINSHQVHVIYDIFGFMPNEITVPIGEKVSITNLTNNSQPGPMLFEEAPDQSPAPFLNLGIINKNQTKSFMASLKGQWQFIDPYQPDEKNRGQITVY